MAPVASNLHFDTLAEVLYALPAGPFTATDVFGRACGLKAIRDPADVELLLERLSDLGLVHRVVSDVDMWMVTSPRRHRA